MRAASGVKQPIFFVVEMMMLWSAIGVNDVILFRNCVTAIIRDVMTFVLLLTWVVTNMGSVNGLLQG